jgi:hypothetical protein
MLMAADAVGLRVRVLCKTHNDDDDGQCSTSIQEEFYPLYRKTVSNLKKSYINKMIKSVQDIINKNTMKNTTQLNQKVTTLFQMDETFRDLLMEINRLNQ